MENQEKLPDKGEILVTRDYEKFSFFEDNRNIKLNHVNSLKENFRNNFKLKVNPIIVDKNFKIIDGQHRFMAAKELQLPVYYIIDFNHKEGDIIQLNVTSRVWRNDDYLKHYCNQNLESYLKIDYLHKKFKMPVITILDVCTNRRVEELKNFKNGTLILRDFEEKQKILYFYDHFCQLIKEKQTLTFLRSIQKNLFFIRAFKTFFLIEDVDVGYFFDKYTKGNILIKKKANTEEYIDLFIEIYNSFRRNNKISKIVNGPVRKYIIFDEKI